MAETLELQQVKCPSCGRVITSFSPFQAEVECPYCHNKAFNPLITAKKIPVPERIIPFKTTQEDFEQHMVAALADTDFVPVDIFEHIQPDNVVKAYLPMYLYEGKYQASWNCQVGYQTQEVGKSTFSDEVKVKTVTKYHPANGVSNGLFSFMCLAYEGNEIPEELKNFAMRFPYSVQDSKEYSPALLNLDTDKDLQTLALNADSDLVWNKWGQTLVDQLASESASEQLNGQNIKDFRCTSSYDLKTEGRFVMAPFWFVYYTYKGNQYYFLMDGLGVNHNYSNPEDEDQLKKAKMFNTIETILKWSWTLAILLWLLVSWKACWITLLVWLGAWLSAKLTFKILLNSMHKKSRQLRSEAAARL